MTSISEKLKDAESILQANGIAEPRRESVSLLMLALGRDRTYVYSYPEHVLSADEALSFDQLVERRANREPLQYISGVQEFYGLEFEVTPDVLIPRPETEMVVEHALEILNGSDCPTICDIGTGSGCILVSILHEFPSSHGIGLDVSSAALAVAQRNAIKHRVDDRTRFQKSDLLASLVDETFDLIVSNPPYVPVRDVSGLQAEVRDFEPQIALTDGADGLSLVSRIVDDAPRFLNPRGSLLMEIGFDQSQKVARMFDPAVWETPQLFPDLQGIPRLVRARVIKGTSSP